jgi:hypothetical protein
MSELFDTIAGSETGAIIGSTLLAGQSVPHTTETFVGEASTTTTYWKQYNKFWASDATSWFEANQEAFYSMTWFPKEVAFFCSIAVAIALGLIAYKCTDRSFEAKDYDDTLIQVDTAISIKKKLVKGKEYDQEDLDARIRHIKKDLSQDF